MTRPFTFVELDETTTTRVKDAVVNRSEHAFTFLERLVAEASTVGEESGAQLVVAGELSRLGLSVSRVDVPESISDDPLAGVPQSSYEGRGDVLATTSGDHLTLLINGHVDVVPADGLGWTNAPWTPVRRDGWLFGRGAGDMKGGLAMATLAIDALREVLPAALALPLGVLSVIEEECTGNGTLAALRQGVTADYVVVTEPTDLEMLVGGTGIVWVDVTVQGAGGHAEAADRLEHPLDAALRLVSLLEDLGRYVAKEHREARFSDLSQPYNVNVGLVRAGDWRSSVASVVTLGVRFGHPTKWTPEQAIEEIKSAVVAAIPNESGLLVTFTSTGFRAQGYLLDEDSPLIGAVGDAHAATHGSRPGTHVGGSTTDARFYLNQANVPALCYGPVARNIHGVDESVELSSIVKGAQTLAHFIAGLASANGLL